MNDARVFLLDQSWGAGANSEETIERLK